MKLGVLVNQQAVLRKLMELQVNGRLAFQLRKGIKSLSAELETFNESKNQYIMDHGQKNIKTGTMEIMPGTPAFDKMIEYMNEMAGAEIPDIVPVFSEKDLEQITISAQELEGFYSLGFVQEPVESKSVSPKLVESELKSVSNKKKAG